MFTRVTCIFERLAKNFPWLLIGEVYRCSDKFILHPWYVLITTSNTWLVRLVNEAVESFIILLY